MGETVYPGGVRVGAAGSGIAELPGRPSSGTLRVAADVVDGTNVVIGVTTFKVAELQTEHAETTLDLDNTEEENHNVLIAAHGLDLTDLILVENEVMEVIGVPDANHVHLRRGVSGTTIASHADATAIYTQATPAGPGSVKVGCGAALTPTAFTARLVADINNPKRSTEQVKAVLIDVNTIFVYSADKPGGNPKSGVFALATTETLGGSGNAWDAATLGGGKAPYIPMLVVGVPTAAEVTKGKIIIPTPFASPVIHKAKFYLTADFTPLAWDGAAAVSGSLVTLDNAGSVDWDADDTYEVLIGEA